MITMAGRQVVFEGLKTRRLLLERQSDDVVSCCHSQAKSLQVDRVLMLMCEVCVVHCQHLLQSPLHEADDCHSMIASSHLG